MSKNELIVWGIFLIALAILFFVMPFELRDGFRRGIAESLRTVAGWLG